MKRLYLLLIIVSCFFLTSCGKRFTVTFDSNGGSYVESVEVKKGKKVQEPDDPVREGYKFVEWQLDGEEFDFDTKIKKDITLVAYWKENVKAKLNTPTNLSYSGGVLTWDSVDKATGYEVYVNGTKKSVKGTSLEIDLTTSALVSVHVVAVGNNAESDKSASIVVKEDKTVSYIYNYFGGEISQQDIIENKEFYNSVVVYTETFGISYNELMQVNSFEKILEYLEAGKVIELGTEFFLIFNDMYVLENKDEVAPSNGAYLSVAIALYEDMKEAGVIVDPKSNAVLDDKFMNLIVPYFFGFREYYPLNEYKLEYYLYKFTREYNYDYYNFNYSIVRNGEAFVFTNELLGAEYSLTEQEIENLITYIYNFCCLSTYESYSYGYLLEDYRAMSSDAQEYIKELEAYNYLEKAVEHLEKSSGKIISAYYANKDELNEIIKDIYAAYETAQGYYEKFSQLGNDYYNATSEEQRAELLKDAKEFSKQVVDLINDTLPSEAEFGLLEDYLFVSVPLFEEMALDDEYANLLLQNTKAYIDAIEGAYGTAVELVEGLGKIIKNFSEEEIKLIFDYIIKQSPELSSSKFLQETINKIYQLVLDTEFDDSIYSYEMFKFFKEAMDQELFVNMSYYLDIQYTEEEYELVIAEVKNMIKYLEDVDIYNLLGVYSTLMSRNIVGGSYTKEQLANIYDTIDFIFNYVEKNHLTKYEEYILSFIQYQFEFDKDTSSLIYNVVKEHYQGAKDFVVFAMKVRLTDSYYSNSNDNILYLIENEFNQSKMTALYNFFEALSNVIPDFNNPLNEISNLCVTDYSQAISLLKSANGKYEWDLTTQEKEMIESYEDVFGSWIFKSPFKISIDTTTDCFVIEFKEDLGNSSKEITYSNSWLYYRLICQYNGMTHIYSGASVNKVKIENNKIYFSLDYFHSNIEDIYEIDNIYLEWESHYVEYKINGVSYIDHIVLDDLDITAYYDYLRGLNK